MESTELTSKVLDLNNQIADLENQKQTHIDSLKNESIKSVLSRQKFTSNYPPDVNHDAALILFHKRVKDEGLTHSYNPENLQHSLKAADGSEIPFNDFINTVLSDGKLIEPVSKPTEKAKDNNLSAMERQLSAFNVKKSESAPSVKKDPALSLMEIQLRAFEGK